MDSQSSLMGKDRLHNSDTQCLKLHTLHKYPIAPLEASPPSPPRITLTKPPYHPKAIPSSHLGLTVPLAVMLVALAIASSLMILQSCEYRLHAEL